MWLGEFSEMLNLDDFRTHVIDPVVAPEHESIQQDPLEACDAFSFIALDIHEDVELQPVVADAGQLSEVHRDVMDDDFVVVGANAVVGKGLQQFVHALWAGVAIGRRAIDWPLAIILPVAVPSGPLTDEEFGSHVRSR